MAKPKRTVYTATGYLVWKGLAVLGVKAAKDKAAEYQKTHRGR